jgi:hypothetical protein
MTKLVLTVGTLIVVLGIGLWTVGSYVVRPVYLADIPWEPFRATEERVFRSAFEPDEITTREILYEPPDNWSTRCDDRPYCSIIILDGRAWNHVGGGAGWREVAPELNPLGQASFAFNWPFVRFDVDDRGDGPTIAGERTQRLGAFDEDYGNGVADDIASHEGSEQVRRTHEGAGMSIEVLKGRTTGRVYEVIVTFAGPNLYDRTRLTFEYGVEVEISPPDTESVSAPSP